MGIHELTPTPVNLEAARSPLKVLNHLDIYRRHQQLLEDLRAVAQIEFHPCDRCNLRCQGCTYGHDEAAIKPEPVCFPFDRLGEIVKFRPRALVITGGGEPLLYRDGQADFGMLVKAIHALLPDTQLALITNGTAGPGQWAEYFRWIRVSVDAATPETYERMRGRSFFDRACETVSWLLAETSVPQVNVGFVYSGGNIAEAFQAARFFYEAVRQSCASELPRLCIDYRPLRRDPADRHSNFPEPASAAAIEGARAEFQDSAKRGDDFARFLEIQTNFRSIAAVNGPKPPQFARCVLPSLYRLIRANGDVRPCCMRLIEPEFDLGNVLRDGAEAVALNAARFALSMPPGCAPGSCRLAALNNLLERPEGHRQSLEIHRNPFF